MDQPTIGTGTDPSAADANRLHDEAALSFAASLLENSSDMVAAVDSSLRLIALNAPFRREFELVFGNPLQSGQQLDEVLSRLPADRDKVSALCQRALAGESFRVTEEFGDEQLLRKSYELAFSPVFDTRRQPIYAAVVVRDLTLMRESEQRFGALLEAAPDATLIIRSDGIVELANAHAERMFGYGRHALLGKPVEQLMPERFHARHVAHRHQFTFRPVPRPMGAGKSQLRGLRADGTEFPVEISLNPLNVGSGMMVVAAIRDVTERQREEDRLRAESAELEQRVRERTEALERANEAFRSTFEQASVGIAHVSTGGKWLRVNRKLCDIVGYSREELLTLTLQDITHPDDLGSDLRLMYKLLAGDLGSYSLNKRYLHKNGSVAWTDLNVSLVRDRSGTPEYFISVVNDISARKRAEDEAEKHKASLELAVAATGVGMFDYFPETGKTNWSPEMKRLFGLSPDAHVDFGVFLEGLHPDDRAQVNDALGRVMLAPQGGRFRFEHRTVGLEDGRERWVEARGQVYFDTAGKAVRCIGTALDVTDKKLAEDKIRRSERELRLIFDANPIGTAKGRQTGEITDANKAFLSIVGRSADELRAGKIRWDQMTPPEHLHADIRAVEQAMMAGVSDLYEKEYVRPNGERVPVLLACAALGNTRELVAFVLDISERKVAEERLRHAALHDTLTGLPNRSLLYDFATRIFGRARREKRHSAVLFIDLDRFKPINDAYGHEVGDEVLKEVARRLAQCTRADDVAFRLGGDEFLLLLPAVDADDNAADVSRHAIDCISQPYHIKGLELSLSASIGISVYPDDGEDIDTLINNADAAMYQAKQAGRGNAQYYSGELAARSQLQLRIEEYLKAALARDAFELHYQPVVDMQSNRVIGVEALVRWAHRDIGPDQFVPVAEATGHIKRLGDWVIGEACRQHKRWCEHGLPPIPIAVNVSAAQLRQKDFAEHFVNALNAWAVGAAALQVEVTETAVMENLDRAIEMLARLKAIGVTIALDDFGTGYSSLNYLSRLPISKIKVDKSFVQRVEHDAPSRAITEAVIALGRSLDLDVVAEGIESEQALRYLRSHGCSQAQGYHVCRPVTAEAFEAWFGRHHPS